MKRKIPTVVCVLLFVCAGLTPFRFILDAPAAFGESQGKGATAVPLTLEDILALLEGRVRPARIKAIVAERGVDFSLNNETERRLRTAGATDDVIIEIAKSYRPPTRPEPKPNPEPPRRSPSNPAPGTVRANSTDGLQYVWIPAGTFMMGCSPGDTECDPDEKPPLEVTITQGFWIGQTEVTVAAYKRFAAAAGRTMPASPNFNNGWANGNMPVVNVSWQDAQAYCGWAGGRLPTEAEWEYAARGGSTDARYGAIDFIAWYHQNSGGQTHEVAQKRANGLGLYDTLGNVWEWVNDWYDENYYRNSPSQDPRGPSSGQLRVLRGGSWNYVARLVRVSGRVGVNPEFRNLSLGFRCVGEVNFP
jgi:formylglycine-generating enzyme required for sulfatase activity